MTNKTSHRRKEDRSIRAAKNGRSCAPVPGPNAPENHPATATDGATTQAGSTTFERVTLTDASRAEALLEDSHFDLGDDWRWRLRVGHSPEYQALLKFDPEAIWFEGQGRDTHDAQKRQQLEHSHEHSHGLSGNERQALNLLGCPLSLVASIEVHSL